MSDTITYDVVADLKTRIVCDWTAGTAPRVDFIWDEKSVGLAGAVREVVLIQPLKEVIVAFQLHGDVWRHDLPVKIDIRTYSTLARHNTVVKEVGRILKNILRRAGASPTPFIQAYLRGYESMDEKYRNMFRGIFTIVYMDTTAFTFT